MRTFDGSLFGLYNDRHISHENALLNADSANELRLNIKLKSARGEPASASDLCLTLDDMDELFPEKDIALAREHELLRQREQAKLRVEREHAERARQQEKRRRMEDEQLESLRKAKAPSEPRPMPMLEPVR